MLFRSGCDGVLTPHATVFARNGRSGPADQARLVIGAAMSAELLPEDIGRPAMVDKVAEGVRAAMRDAGLEDAADVHYVQTKTPLLTIESVADALRRGHAVACKVHESMDVSNGTTALGIAVALGEIAIAREKGTRCSNAQASQRTRVTPWAPLFRRSASRGSDLADSFAAIRLAAFPRDSSPGSVSPPEFRTHVVGRPPAHSPTSTIAMTGPPPWGP